MNFSNRKHHWLDPTANTLFPSHNPFSPNFPTLHLATSQIDANSESPLLIFFPLPTKTRTRPICATIWGLSKKKGKTNREKENNLNQL